MESAELGRAAVALMMVRIAGSLSEFRVDFDSWSYESALHDGEPSPVAHTLSILEQQGHTYRSEGALWLRSTDYGDDKDRVLLRANGEHTYFASDIAYHQDKRERGFDRQIDVWGADHHGYVGRMKAAYEALGGDPEHLEMLIMQLVHLVRRGERAQMSKRAGEFVTLEDLLREIGVDAARWFLLAARTTRRSTSTWTSPASSQARTRSTTCSTRTRVSPRCSRRPAPSTSQRALGGCGGSEDEHERLAPSRARADQEAARLPRRGRRSSRASRPASDSRLRAGAGPAVHGFLPRLPRARRRVPALEAQRLALCVASRQTIARSLDLLGVDAPAEM